jgi:enoyl-CoA hydratase
VTTEPNEPLVLVAKKGRALDLLINRPKSLNALSLPMIDLMTAPLLAAAADPATACVLLRGAGGRAFCAGGDVRNIAQTLKIPGQTLSYDFFFHEYRLNHLIHSYPKPFIALIEGVCMGGGVGLSAHGALRVAADNLAFAMPETAIGLFPDVGGTWFLPRYPGTIGMYLALTGARLGAADALYVGFATHVVAAARMDEVHQALIDAAPETVEAAKAVVEPFRIDPGAPPLEAHRAAIDRCFSADSYREVVQRLAGEDTDWARSILADLAKKSPTSLLVTFEQLRNGRGLDVKSCLIREFRMSQHCMAASDFAEGIRAVLIDKDHHPIWRPARIEDISHATVMGYFAPHGAPDLNFDDLT